MRDANILTAMAMPAIPVERRTTGRSRRAQVDTLLLRSGLAMLALILVVVGLALAYRSTLQYQINYNEGWNSAIVGRLLAGLPLYPDRSEPLINNYPPLSFYAVALLSKVTGSVLVAGRLLAWMSLLACIGMIAVVLRALGADRAGAALGCLFFGAAIVVRCDLYVGMFDPQFFGLALMLAGLWAVIRSGTPMTALGAALVVLGGFVKHSLIGLPVTVTVWLLLCRRRQLLAWIGTGVGLAAAGLAVCVWRYGPPFLSGLAMPRYASAADGARKVLKWLLPLELPCVLAAVPILFEGEAGLLVGIYLPVSLLASVAGAAPRATNYNMIFEVLVATSLGLGLLAGRHRNRVPAGFVAAAAALSVLITGTELITAEASPPTWLATQRSRDVTARATVALLRSRPGPALCGTLLYCFEAGKPFAFDPLNYGMLPGRDQSALRHEIERRAYVTIQLDAANMYFTPSTRDAIAVAYRAVPGLDGVFTPSD